MTIKNVFPDEEHIRNLNFGVARLLPVRDLFGRCIIFFEPGRIHGQNYATSIMVSPYEIVYFYAIPFLLMTSLPPLSCTLLGLI
mmetsp:Transcript_18978/g.26152  ORF Transcript_18978/g.26152 Transcript_18978/m.26152 type:complete len:84 (-) Transcript_18978:611-862(-)